jgi:hypothetical protein
LVTTNVSIGKSDFTLRVDMTKANNAGIYFLDSACTEPPEFASYNTWNCAFYGIKGANLANTVGGTWLVFQNNSFGTQTTYEVQISNTSFGIWNAVGSAFMGPSFLLSRFQFDKINSTTFSIYNIQDNSTVLFNMTVSDPNFANFTNAINVSRLGIYAYTGGSMTLDDLSVTKYNTITMDYKTFNNFRNPVVANEGDRNVFKTRFSESDPGQYYVDCDVTYGRFWDAGEATKFWDGDGKLRRYFTVPSPLALNTSFINELWGLAQVEAEGPVAAYQNTYVASGWRVGDKAQITNLTCNLPGTVTIETSNSSAHLDWYVDPNLYAFGSNVEVNCSLTIMPYTYSIPITRQVKQYVQVYRFEHPNFEYEGVEDVALNRDATTGWRLEDIFTDYKVTSACCNLSVPYSISYTSDRKSFIANWNADGNIYQPGDVVNVKCFAAYSTNISSTTQCTQDLANVSSCVGTSYCSGTNLLGAYGGPGTSCTGCSQDPYCLVDENDTTYATSVWTLYSNWSKPVGAKSATYRYLYGASLNVYCNTNMALSPQWFSRSVNLSWDGITNTGCFDQNPIQLRFSSLVEGFPSYRLNLACWNGTEWRYIHLNNTYTSPWNVYDEEMVWQYDYGSQELNEYVEVGKNLKALVAKG